MAQELREVEFMEHPGEVVTLRLSGIPMREYFGILRDWDGATSADQWEALFTRFAGAGCIAAWTFREEPNADGLMERDFPLARAIVRTWITEVRSVPSPLPLRRSDGTPSESEPSQPSSDTPS